jgi:hypothetical protein
MKTTAHGLFLLLLVGGCADSGKKTDAKVGPPVNAERLLASTLDRAKADNKRVMVHLGAAW